MPFVENAVIAAAGIGSRLGHGIPKCLVEVPGGMLIERQLALMQDIPDVRVVVGYMEQAVMDAVRRCREDVIFVRNDRYRETTTQDSYLLGAAGIEQPCLFVDGDIVFDPASFRGFLEFAVSRPLAIGVTAAKTENAVYAAVRPADRGGIELVSFSREPSEYEWANIVYTSPSIFRAGAGNVFETLREFLPAPAAEIVCYEVDTVGDLERARSFSASLGR